MVHPHPKADLNLTRSREISDFCKRRNVEIVGRIPYDTVVTDAMVSGLPVTAYTDGPATEALREVWTHITDTFLVK